MDDFPAKHMKKKYTKSVPFLSARQVHSVMISCSEYLYKIKKRHLNCTSFWQTAIGFIVRDAAWRGQIISMADLW
jgi:hypothetical protein